MTMDTLTGASRPPLPQEGEDRGEGLGTMAK